MSDKVKEKMKALVLKQVSDLVDKGADVSWGELLREEPVIGLDFPRVMSDGKEMHIRLRYKEPRILVEASSV